MKFDVNDQVIGNENASSVYSITGTGWVGKVLKTYEDYILVANAEYPMGFWVASEYFYLYRQSAEPDDTDTEFMAIMF